MKFSEKWKSIRLILLLSSADVGLGILSAVLVSYIFDIDINFSFIIFGVVFALLPDFDFLVHYFSNKTIEGKDHEHRDIIHYPIIYLVIGSLIAFSLFGKYFASLFFVASFFHFIHDSIGIGWGVKWLFPFSDKNFAFLYLYSRKEKSGLRKFILSFDKESLGYYAKEHGDVGWFKNIYGRWHPIVVVEFSIFIISLIILFFYVG